MMKRISIFLLVAIFALMFMPTPQAFAAGDSVKITYITPTALSSNKNPVTFTAKVNYTLASAKTGILGLVLFSPGAGKEITSIEILKGSGTLTLSGQYIPGEWKTLPNKIAVIMRPGDSLIGSASDYHTLNSISSDPQETVVTSIAVAQKTVYLKKGKSAKLGAVPVTSDGKSAKITWTSNKPKIVSVDKNGKVKALKAGKATITVKAENGKSAKITVNVGGKPIKSLAIKNPPKNNTMKVGATLKMNITPKPSNAQGVLTFKSSKTKIISVNTAGQLKALKPGTSTITVSMDGKKATLKITVKK